MSIRYFQENIECASRDEIEKIQSDLLVKQVKHVYDNVPYYKNKMDAIGVKPEDIRGIEDLHKLPFLCKDDLRDAYPFGMLAVPKEQVVKVHATSGTTGKRVLGFYTAEDMESWQECMARTIVSAGGSSEDICQISYGYGLFTGGLGFDGGAQKAGCMVIPMSSGNTDRQIQFIQDLGTTILCCTASYAAYIGEVIQEKGIAPEDFPLKTAIFGAEPWTEEMRANIESAMGVKAYDTYGLTELGGPGIGFECIEQKGLHINEDHFIAEIIDPKTGEILPDGEKGELVLTSIKKQAFPMLRYRTKDICVLSKEKCSCGRSFIKMSKPLGRSDDMMIIRGVNVFPSQIETVLLSCEYQPNYLIEVDRVNYADTIDIYVEMLKDNMSDKEIASEEKRLAVAMRTMLGITCKMHLVPIKSIERSEGKAKRIIDKRNLIG